MEPAGYMTYTVARSSLDQCFYGIITLSLLKTDFLFNIIDISEHLIPIVSKKKNIYQHFKTSSTSILLLQIPVSINSKTK